MGDQTIFDLSGIEKNAHMGFTGIKSGCDSTIKFCKNRLVKSKSLSETFQVFTCPIVLAGNLKGLSGVLEVVCEVI